MNYEAIAEYSQIASAALFVLVMIWIWIRFIQPAVLSAQQNANAQIAQAERHRDEAKAALDSLQGEIASAQQDAAAIRQRAERQAKREREALLRETHEAGDRALANAQGELARARASARDRFRDELLENALDLARSEAAARVDAALNGRLVTQFVGSLRGERG